MQSLFAVPLFLAAVLASSGVSAQLLVPLTTPDGRVACTQGMTGIGRPATIAL